jgi:hypothetical protein
MKKRPYFETARRVVAFFDKNPRMTSVEIGKELGLHPAYIRKALMRNGRRLARSPSNRLREAA